MKQPGDRPNHQPQACVHHWMCGDQRSATVHAVCRKCGAEADFEQQWYYPGMIKRSSARATPRPTVPAAAPT